MVQFKKYKQNLSIVVVNGEAYVKSYSTLVALIDYEKMTIKQLGWWSMTTQKHINYVAKELNLKLIK